MALIQKRGLGANSVDGSKILLSNNEVLRARNAANTADVSVLKVNGTDEVEFVLLPKHGGSNVATESFVNTKAADYIPLSQRGVANGVATLDGNSKVPAAQLPSFVDDILEQAATKATIAVQDLTYTADNGGTAGNSVSVTYVNPGVANATISVSVSGSDITVNLATDGLGALTSTADQIKTAVDGLAAAAALVDVTVSGTGTTVQAAQAKTLLAGGKSALDSLPATGEAGKLYVTLDTNRVYRWSGSQYTEVKGGDVDSVNGKTGAVTLTTTDIAEGTNEYFTVAKARAAAVVNSTAGTETDQAPSVASIKSYVDSKTARVDTEVHTLSSVDITNGYKDLARQVVKVLDVTPKGYPMQFEGDDFSLSVVGGVTRITFAGDMLTLQGGDKLSVLYTY